MKLIKSTSINNGCVATFLQMFFVCLHPKLLRAIVFADMSMRLMMLEVLSTYQKLCSVQLKARIITMIVQIKLLVATASIVYINYLVDTEREMDVVVKLVLDK